MTIAPEKAPPGTAAVIIIRPRQGGPGLKYTIPMSALAKLGPMNNELDPRGRYDAVMAADGLFQVEPALKGSARRIAANVAKLLE